MSAKPKILVVEDNEGIRSVIANALEGRRCQVFEAENGLDGLTLARREQPDFLILDLMMPVMDGMEMLCKVKADSDFADMPVLILTGDLTRERVVKAARLGVHDYLLKPFSQQTLLERISRIIDLPEMDEAATRIRTFDDPLSILVVDDKPGILDRIKAGLAVTNWKVEGRARVAEAAEYCAGSLPDAILISLSVSGNGAFTFLRTLRGSARTRHVPVFALCLKNAVDDQRRARESGFTGVITKPIDPSELERSIARALNLDASQRYFEQRDGLLLLKAPVQFSPAVAGEIMACLRAKVCDAVDAGLDGMILDVSQVTNPDGNVIRLGQAAVQVCQELTLKLGMVGSEAVSNACAACAESRDWKFAVSYEEALARFDAPAPA